MPLRFFFDECVDEHAATALKNLGLDVLTVTDAARKGLSDVEQFEFACREQRVIYTVDRDFLKIATACLKRGESFPGLVFHQDKSRTVKQIIEAFELLNGVLEPSDMRDQIEYI